ncbi:MAG: RNA polymerase sigma factor [Candidatus Eiseniibacteriota bacterium]
MARKVDEDRARLEALGDGDLARLCAAGDERAWETLVRRYRRLVYAVPNRAGLPADEVEEVFHGTYARLAERIRSIRDPERIRPWIVTTARRLTIDCMRARRDRREIGVPDESLALAPDPAELAPEAMDRLERQHAVRQALLGLGDRCRRLLTALFYDRSQTSPSYDGISRELGIPIGSIGPTRARCLEKLREAVLRIIAV